jgi:hypothetical protein
MAFRYIRGGFDRYGLCIAGRGSAAMRELDEPQPAPHHYNFLNNRSGKAFQRDQARTSSDAAGYASGPL